VRVRVEVVLPVDAGSAWAALVEWERQPEWMVDAASVRVVSDRRSGAGVRIAVRTRILGVPALTDVLEVTEWDPPSRFVMARSGFVRGSGAWELAPAQDGTVFRWSEDIRLPIPVLGELALLLYRPVMRRLMRRSLRNLAAQLE